MSKVESSDSQKSVNSIRQPDKIVSEISKDQLKSLFYLFAGRPDSKTKVFKRRIIISSEDLYHLNDLVFDKFRLHTIDEVVATSVVKFKKQELIQFGIWKEFLEFDWRIPSITQEISIRWDFMIRISEFQAPQRHTLTVKISNGPNPREILRFLMSQDEDDEELEGKLGVCLARVDFISHRLADELIDVVSRWNDGLRQPEIEAGWFNSLEKYDKWIARSVHYSIPLMFTLLACFVLRKLLQKNDAELIRSYQLMIGLQWLLISGLGITGVLSFGKYLAAKVYRAINEYGLYTPFQLTNGDSNLAQENKTRNKTLVTSFILNIFIPIALNVIAALIMWWLGY